MVLELVYSDEERELAESTSTQIWDILYKETVAEVMQFDGSEVRGDHDEGEGGGDGGDDESRADSEETEADDQEIQSPPPGRNSEAVERGTQVEVG